MHIHATTIVPAHSCRRTDHFRTNTDAGCKTNLGQDDLADARAQAEKRTDTTFQSSQNEHNDHVCITTKIPLTLAIVRGDRCNAGTPTHDTHVT